jgi:hypothetical protein
MIFLSKWFYDTSPDTALEQSTVVHCWRGLGLSSSQQWKKHGEHENLRGSDRRSVTPYVYKRCVLMSVCDIQALSGTYLKELV